MTIALTHLTAMELEIFQLRLNYRYLIAYGTDYENFVGEILQRCYPGDFIPVSSGGGDNKNDGIVRSLRQLYQCYAPMKFENAAALNKKIREDYEGAIENWADYFDVWKFAFCHPKDDGLNHATTKLVLDLELEHKKKIEVVPRSELVELALSLPKIKLVLWLGPLPFSPAELGDDLKLDVIGTVVQAIAQPSALVDDLENVEPVPPTKLAYNRISEEVLEYIEKGKGLNNRVTQYLSTQENPILGDQMAESFQREYQNFRTQHGDNSDTIYWRLYEFIRGRSPNPMTKDQELAAHAILSYLFHRCDIFERPPPDWTGH